MKLKTTCSHEASSLVPQTLKGRGYGGGWKVGATVVDGRSGLVGESQSEGKMKYQKLKIKMTGKNAKIIAEVLSLFAFGVLNLFRVYKFGFEIYYI